MEIKLSGETFDAYELVCAACASAHADSELTLPDGSFGRILSCRHQCRIREKNLTGGMIEIKGEADAAIIYADSSGEAKFAAAAVPFSVNIDAQGADSACVSLVRIVSSELNAQYLGSGRITLALDVSAEQHCYKMRAVCIPTPPEERPRGVFFKTEALTYRSISLVSEKMFSLDGEPELPESLRDAELICAESKIKITGSEHVGSKLIIKGEAEIKALHLVGGAPTETALSMPFSQLFDMPESADDPDVFANIIITGQNFGQLDGRLRCDIHGAVQVVCLNERESEYISDAYSCHKRIDISHESLNLIKSAAKRDISCTAELSYGSGAAAEIILASASAGAPQILGGKAYVPVRADIIYRDSDGAMQSCVIRGAAEAELECEAGEATIISANAKATVSGGDIKSVVTLELEARSAVRCEENVIIGIDMTDDDLPKRDCSIYMCRCADRDLWSLAKRLGSDEDEIRAINGIEDEVPCDRLLIVPVV